MPRARLAASADERFDVSVGTVCLDYYWGRGSCLSIGKYEATRLTCDDRSHLNREKPMNLIVNTTTNVGYPTGGFPHAVRTFTICTETQK